MGNKFSVQYFTCNMKRNLLLKWQIHARAGVCVLPIVSIRARYRFKCMMSSDMYAFVLPVVCLIIVPLMNTSFSCRWSFVCGDIFVTTN